MAAHPDDELLGPGATLHQIAGKTDANIHVVILGEGLTSRADERDPDAWQEEMNEHRRNIEDAKKEIGYHSVSIYDFPDNRFDSVPLLDIIKVVEKEKEQFRPDIIFTHHGGDVNVDHQLTFDAVKTAFRPLQGESLQTIFTFETPSGTEWIPSTDSRQFIPDFFVEVGKEDLEAKCRAMEMYEFEKREYPHPRSAEALKIRAAYWGQAAGVAYAEAFRHVRTVLKQS